jgi:tetratricopeptide (TPR) repeat protein
MEESQAKLYWQGRVFYIYGFFEQSENRREEAKNCFLSSQTLAEEALSFGEFSEGYRLLADAYAQLLNYNGIFYKMSTGRKIMDLATKAIQLDPRNVKAHLTLAISYMFAPPIAGGGLHRSLETLHKLESFSGVERQDRFSINAWLGMAYSKKGEEKKAIKYFRNALSIYPGNSWMKNTIEDLKS